MVTFDHQCLHFCLTLSLALALKLVALLTSLIKYYVNGRWYQKRSVSRECMKDSNREN